MGNRAVIAFKSMPTVGIYLHWNGGPESVFAFLEETKARGARNPNGDSTYALARLTQTITEFFTREGGSPEYSTSVGVGPLCELDTDNGDNGLYWVGEGYQVVSREHCRESIAELKPEQLSKNGWTRGDRRCPSPFERYEGMLEALRGMRAVAAG